MVRPDQHRRHIRSIWLRSCPAGTPKLFANTFLLVYARLFPTSIRWERAPVPGHDAVHSMAPRTAGNGGFGNISSLWARALGCTCCNFSASPAVVRMRAAWCMSFGWKLWESDPAPISPRAAAGDVAESSTPSHAADGRPRFDSVALTLAAAPQSGFEIFSLLAGAAVTGISRSRSVFILLPLCRKYPWPGPQRGHNVVCAFAFILLCAWIRFSGAPQHPDRPVPSNARTGRYGPGAGTFLCGAITL